MAPRTTTVAIALLAFLAGVTAGGGAALATLQDPFTGQPDAALQRFDTVAVGCVDPTEPGAVDRALSAPNGSGNDLTLRQNVTAPSPDATLDARFDRIAPGTYLLDVETVTGGDDGRTCESGRPEARFVANLTLPDEYTLVLLRDGEYLGVNYASSGPMSGSAGGGRSVSGGGGSGDGAAGGSPTGGAAGDDATGTAS